MARRKSLRKNKNTPRKSTDISRNSSKTEKSVNGPEIKEGNCILKDILKKKFKIFRVSPFFNFNSRSLRLYGKKLSEGLRSNKPNSEITYECFFTFDENLQINNQFMDFLQVKVISSQNRCVYNGHFISIMDNNEKSQDFVSLPLLLVEGKSFDSQAVHKYVSEMFDSDIQPATLTFKALVVLFVKFLETPDKDIIASEENLRLMYRIPGCPKTDCLKVTFPLKDTIVILAVIIDSLREKVMEITNMEIIIEFYHILLNHIYNSYKLDLLMAELHTIIFPNAYFNSDGELRIMTESAALVALNLLQYCTSLDALMDA